MQVQPYLFFDGRAEEAIDFYKAALGAKVQSLMRFKEAPVPEGRPGPSQALGEKIMHADLDVAGAHILISDGMGQGGQPTFAGFSLTIVCPDDATTEKVFAALADGGEVRQPLETTFFSSRFGMLGDKFGVGWIVLTRV